MEDQLKYLVVGTVKSMAYAGGIKTTEENKEFITNPDNWKLVATKHRIINLTKFWCFEYVQPEEAEDFFLQLEVRTEYNTVVAFNLITKEEDRIIQYEDN